MMKHYQYMYYRLVIWLQYVNSVPATSATMLLIICNGFNLVALIAVIKYGLGVPLYLSSKLVAVAIGVILCMFNFFSLEDKLEEIHENYKEEPEETQAKSELYLIVYMVVSVLLLTVAICVQQMILHRG
ncbi:hypothetical protein [Xanthocytophaga flava]|uniref:hypothetical protein n=1 Tax=Xanthocytophaga flava TaxID=3048013 RepID=UPI0028D45B04|nr:hypothetical protein [Xanthocytophaga flavus]MDJ1467587.1 hypothetical protein [Xanthocytophaga flavus]